MTGTELVRFRMKKKFICYEFENFNNVSLYKFVTKFSLNKSSDQRFFGRFVMFLFITDT